ncbi:Peptidase family U32 [compost metagenome]
MSHTCQVLLAELPALQQAGVSHIRLSPQHCDMADVAEVFAAVRDGRIDAAEGEARLHVIYPDVPFSNGFYHGTTGAAWIPAGPVAEQVSA